MNLIVNTQPITSTAFAALLYSREQDELICDRCMDPYEPVVAIMLIDVIDKAFALCGKCEGELPRGYQAV